MGQCPNCGATSTHEHAFCLSCGAELTAASGANEATSSQALSPAGTGEGVPRRSTSGIAPQRTMREPGRGRGAKRTLGANTIPMTAAIALSVVMQEAINLLVPAEAYLYRLFRPAGGWVMSVVPALIAFVLIWTLTDLVLKFRVARVNERDLGRPEIGRLPAYVAQEATGVTLQRIRAWDARILARPVGRRMLWLLQHLDTTDSRQAHELVRHQSDLEADTAASGYRTVKLFIWAMPILGFIGTVLGISLAVGGFSDFLTTDVSIDEIDRVTAELGNVASGLSFAFDTTLLGLLAGLIASVASSGVQAREERFLTSVDELGLRVMESALPASAAAKSTSESPREPSDAKAVTAAAAEFEEVMRGRLEQLSSQMDGFTRAVRTGLDGFLHEWSKLPPEIARVTTDLGALREQLASTVKSTDQLILETRVMLEGLSEASQHMGRGLEATLGSVTDTVGGMAMSLQGVSDSLADSVAKLGERVTSEGSIRALSASVAELGERLDDLRSTQVALEPLLAQLAGPLELHVMPATPRGEGVGRRTRPERDYDSS